MDDLGVAELVCLHLWDEPPDEADRGRQRASVAELAAALGLSETMADRLSLLSAISTLQGNGLVTETTSVAERETERNLYSLTEAGRRRALDRYEALRDERVVVHDGEDRTTLRLVEAADALEQSLASVLARRSPDGDLYVEETAPERFVDRAAELDRLADALEACLDGRPRTALVTGEAGVGKTTLVEAFADRARDRGATVAVGRCSRADGEPYGAVREAAEALESTAFSELTRAQSRADADDATVYRAQRAVLFSRVTERLTERARESPTVLVIEDLQWADAATIDLLAHVAAESYQAPLCLVGTYRPEGVADEHPLRERLAEREDVDERLVDLVLEPFDGEATRSLVEAEVGRRGVPADFVDAVSEATGGNPLFVVETIAQLREEGRLDPRIDRYPASTSAVSLPEAVETTIERRLDRLDGPTRAVLAAGAVAGDPIPRALLVRCCGLSSTALGERVDLLVDGGVWVRDDGLRFRSDVVRSVVLASLDDEQRRRFHREAAGYRIDAGSTQSAEIARHFERADEPERALEYYRRAADEATAVYAHDVAVEHYERALAIARELDRDETVLDLLEALGEIHATRGDYDEAEKHFRYVRERTDDPERVRRSYRYQAKMAFDASEYDDAEAYARRGLEGGGDEITEEVCWLTDYLGGAYWGRGEYEAAIEHHEQLRERAAEIDFTLSLGRAHQNLGCCYGALGEVDRSIELVERGVEVLEGAGDEGVLAGCINDLAVAYGRAGDHEAAVETMERCLELAERTGRVTVIRSAQINLASYALQRGELGTARERSDEARTIAERIDDRHLTAVAVWIEGSIDLEVGRVDDAIEAYEVALELVRETDANHRIAEFEWGLGYARYLASDLDRADEHLDRALELAAEHDFARTIGACKTLRGTIARERGDLDRAIDVQREGLNTVSDADDDVFRHVAEMGLARTLLRTGEADEALGLAREASKRMADGNPLSVVKIDATYGAAQLAVGDREAARETLESTLERARDLSNEAVVLALRELGRLEAIEDDASAARERLEKGRRIAEEAGMRVFVPHFDELLASLGGASAGGSDGE